MIVTGLVLPHLWMRQLHLHPRPQKSRQTEIAAAPPSQFRSISSRNAASPQHNQRRSAVLHHRDQLCRRLPRIERNYDQTFCHDRQIHRYPANAVRCQQAAPVALFQVPSTRETFAPCESFQQLVAGHAGDFAVANFGRIRRIRSRFAVATISLSMKCSYSICGCTSRSLARL